MTIHPDHATDLRAIVFEQGSAEAPDSPGGAERVRIATDGSLEYQQQWGGHRRAVRGRIAPSEVLRVFEILARTSFPDPPQTTFAPGASVCTITVEPAALAVSIDYHRALEMDGYREVIRDLDDLNNALRVSDRIVLDRWQFQVEGASP